MTTTKPRTVPTVGSVLENAANADRIESVAPTIGKVANSEPAPIAQRFVDCAATERSVDAFIFHLASATQAYVANVEARITAAGELRTNKAHLDLIRSYALSEGVTATVTKAARIDGKTVDIREAQLAVICNEDPNYTGAAEDIAAWEAAMDAAVGRADACRELCRNIRLVIQALVPNELANGETEVQA